jgi:ketosteroid isomerase-like protein|tara:strand:+ start:185 stop:721 length:537 start_codon:yes stop_codon:yes gene_type:complete
MNKILLSISLLLLVNPSFAGHHETDEKLAKAAHGYHFSDKGDKYEIFPGDMSMVDIVVNYANAHNDRDLEAIKNATAEDFKAWLPNGVIINGRAAHAEFLKEIFATSNQKWEFQWGTANNVVVSDGNDSIEQWVNVGFRTTYTMDGKEIIQQQVHNVYIENGKIGRIAVHSRRIMPKE